MCLSVVRGNEDTHVLNDVRAAAHNEQFISVHQYGNTVHSVLFCFAAISYSLKLFNNRILNEEEGKRDN